MSKKKNVSHRNKSPYGWWVAILVERLELKGEDRKNLNRRCTFDENIHLIKAKDRDEAYQKAMNLGKVGHNLKMTFEDGTKGGWVFEGVSELLPIYDELEDGAEILWTRHFSKAVKTAKAMVRKKSELSVFDDHDSF